MSRNFEGAALAIFLAGASILAIPPAAHAALIGNGGFEEDAGVGLDGDNFLALPGGSGTGKWSTYESLPGVWTSPKGVIEIQTQNTLSPSLGPYAGAYYVELDADPDTNVNSSMQQTFSGGAAAGSYQTLSYYYRPRTSTTGDNGIQVTFNGTLLHPELTGNGTQPSGWVQLQKSVLVLASNTILFEAFGEANKLGGLIDNVYLTPIPAAAWLFGSAFLGLCWLGRRNATGAVGMLPRAPSTDASA